MLGHVQVPHYLVAFFSAAALAVTAWAASTTAVAPLPATAVAMASVSDDAAQIRQVVEDYGEGLRTGDVARLERAFHPQAIMTGYLGDDLLIIPIEGMYESVRSTPSPMETGEPFAYELANMDIVGGTATADVVEKSFRSFDFLTRFHLVRIDDGWQIVSKIFSITGPAEAS
jgi:hypothetical protein